MKSNNNLNFIIKNNEDTTAQYKLLDNNNEYSTISYFFLLFKTNTGNLTKNITLNY